MNLKREKLKMTLSSPIYGWSNVCIQNPTNKKRNVKIAHSYVFPFFWDFAEAFKVIKFKKRYEIYIEEEGPVTLIRFDNLGKDVKVSINKLYCKDYLKKNYFYYFKPFSFICNKEELKRDYKKTMLNHLKKCRNGYDHEYFDWQYKVSDLREIR